MPPTAPLAEVQAAVNINVTSVHAAFNALYAPWKEAGKGAFFLTGQRGPSWDPPKIGGWVGCSCEQLSLPRGLLPVNIAVKAACRECTHTSAVLTYPRVAALYHCRWWIC